MKLSKTKRVLMMSLICVPLLTACGSVNKKFETKSASSSSSVNNKLATPKAVTSEKTLTNAEAKDINPELNDLYNQKPEMQTSQHKISAMSSFFDSQTQGVYFPSAIDDGQLQENHQDISIHIPKQSQKATYRVANHFIVELFTNQMVIHPVHTVQSVSGITKKNQKLGQAKADEYNSKYGAKITSDVRNRLHKDKVIEMRYIPLKVISTIKPSVKTNGLSVKLVQMNQQLKFANGNIKSQNVLMKFYFSTGKTIKTKIKTSSGKETFTTPKSQKPKGALVGFSLNKDVNTINYMNQKLNDEALSTLAQNLLVSIKQDTSNVNAK